MGYVMIRFSSLFSGIGGFGAEVYKDGFEIIKDFNSR